MSADNAIFIAGFQDGYRIKHDSSIVYEYISNIIDPKELLSFFRNMFQNGSIFESYDDAYAAAEHLSKNYFAEYGIHNLGFYDFSLCGENKMNDDYDNLFWIVVNKQFPTRVAYKHGSLQSATDEARRLAKNNTGEEFIVMQAVESYVYSEYIKKTFVDPSDNPNDPKFYPF